MRTLVVYESIFGNTREVALAITGALSARGPAQAVEVSAAPVDLRPFDLVVVGAPIHAWGMTRAGTRAGARQEAERAGIAPVSPGIGVREWLAALGPARPGQCALAFDTAVHLPRPIPQGSAAGPEAGRLAALGFTVLGDPEHFYVRDKDGPLIDGELDRARTWAREAVAAAEVAGMDRRVGHGVVASGGDGAPPEGARPDPARRIPRRGLVIALVAFAALSALAGGGELLLWPRGTPFVPLALLDGTAFPTFTVPGLLLGGVVGGSAVVALVLAALRSRYAQDGLLVAGGAQTVWIVAEVAQMRELHWLHALYLALGTALLALALAPGWPRDPRLRWVVGVTFAEGLAFLVPAAVGVATATVDPGPRAALLVLAGFAEGLLLGAGQAMVAPVPVRAGRFALLSGIGAAIAWATFGLAPTLGGAGAFGVVAAVGAGLVGLTAMAVLPWLELREHGVGRRWIGWSAAAWALALPMSFLPGLLVDERTPVVTVAVLWACGGLVMAHVYAHVSWGGLRGVGARLRAFVRVDGHGGGPVGSAGPRTLRRRDAPG